MSKPAERRAAELFDAYLDDKLKGDIKPASVYLNQCPASEREELQDAFGGADFLLERYSCPGMKQSTLDKLFREIQGMQQAQRALQQARERAHHIERAPETHSRDPADYLRSLFDFPASLFAPSRAPAGGEFAFMHRGTALGARTTDELQLRTMERSLAPKAEALLQQLTLAQAPVDVDLVAEGLGLFVEEMALPAGTDGCIGTDGIIGGILLNSSIRDPHRRRFTLAHEIGHFVLHKHDIRFLRESVDEVGSFFHDRTEKEANSFAGFLLMPPSLMEARFGQELPSLAQADRLIERFYVSLAAALRRVVRESNWRCALVVTREGVIQWSVRSRDFEGYIRSGQRPHRDTVANLLLRTGGQHEDHNRLPAATWTEGALVEEEAELWEESRRLENGYVYTLLRVMDPEY